MKTDPPQPSSKPEQAQRPTGKVFDVMRPGKAPASPTSRPVIVGHKPKVQSSQIAVSGIGERENLLDSHKKVAITPTDGEPVAITTPVHTPDAPVTHTQEKAAKQVVAQEELPVEPLPAASMDLAAAAMDSEVQADTDVVAAAQAEAEATAAAPAPAEPDDQLTAASVPAAQPMPLNPAASEQPLPNVKPLTPEELAAANAEVADMRMPGEAPIIETHAGGNHWLRTLVVAGIVIVLAISVVDILLDAQVVTIHGIPHTHFFGM